MAQRGRRIEKGWRYTLAQGVLWLLFGRRWHHISPWPMAGVGAAVVVVNRGRVLLHQRRGHIEHPGFWGCNGGYLDLDQQETIVQGLVREFWEETGLRLDPACLTQPLWVSVFYQQEKILMANHTGVSIWFALAADENLVQQIQETEEAHHFRWASAAEIEAMRGRGEIVSHEVDTAIGKALAAAQVAPLPVLKLLA
jgi:8-oxo-dGTP pyrophosphatase MutT (NUDIX family)